MQFQIIVLGAGIIGVSSALHLQAKGYQVALIDKASPGKGTSYGNAGLIERSSVIPYSFPREFTSLLRYGLNRQADVRYSLSFLPKAAPWLLSYWNHSAPAALDNAAAAMLPLIERCVAEHDQFIDAAKLERLVKDQGWIEIFRSEKAFSKAKEDALALTKYGLAFDLLDGPALREREPHLSQKVVGGIHWLDPKTVSNPGALVEGYCALFKQRGGQVLHGDARTLKQTSDQWQIDSHNGIITAPEVVVALGPQSPDVYTPLGYRFPMGIKRGYHQHYRKLDNVNLEHPVCDTKGGFVLSQMDMGIRLTTGVELANSEEAVNAIQLERCEKIARSLFPLGEPVDVEPWLGLRPCFPDMKPIIGPAPKHKGLWFNFGHAHHGLTLGPVCGRLLSEMMAGDTPFTSPAPYSATRFKY